MKLVVRINQRLPRFEDNTNIKKKKNFYLLRLQNDYNFKSDISTIILRRVHYKLCTSCRNII
jgi:hypothetical protein